MYFYYFVAALGPKYKKYLGWKQHLTRIQILQFVIVIFYFASIMIRNCRFQTHDTVTVLLSINTVTFLYLFIKYYQNAYHKKPVEKKKIDIDMANNNVDTKPDAYKKKE